MEIGKSIIDIIKQRKSIRSYDNKTLSTEIMNSLESFFQGIKGPFEAKVRLKLVNITDNENDGLKLGTYGVIKGAKTFLVGAVEKGDHDLEEIGYIFEKVILYITSLDLGTCWLGGTFNRGEFAKAIGLKDNELLPVVTPVGNIREQKNLIDSFFRYVAGSDNRKEWKEIFFNQNFNKSLQQEEAGYFKNPLEMIRLAPSASNRQPWRIVVDGQRCHFYLQKTPRYSDKLGFDIQRIDMGIAMCHFELTLLETGNKGQWIINPPKLEAIPENTYYIVTWANQ